MEARFEKERNNYQKDKQQIQSTLNGRLEAAEEKWRQSEKDKAVLSKENAQLRAENEALAQKVKEAESQIAKGNLQTDAKQLAQSKAALDEVVGSLIHGY